MLFQAMHPVLMHAAPCCRPFGTSVLLAAKDRDGPQLYLIDPAGTSYVSFSVLLLHCRCRAQLRGLSLVDVDLWSRHVWHLQPLEMQYAVSVHSDILAKANRLPLSALNKHIRCGLPPSGC